MDVVQIAREFGLIGAVVIALIFWLLPPIALYLRFQGQLSTAKLNSEVEKLNIQNEHEKRDHEMQMKIQEAILQMNKKAEERIDHYTKESERKDKEIAQLRQDNSRHAELRAQAETLADERGAVADERKQMIDTLLEDLRATNGKLLKATTDLGEYKNLNQRLEDLHKSVETLQRELSKAKERNEVLIAERAELKQQNAILEAEKRRLEEREKHLNQEIETLRDQVTQLAMRVGQMEREQFDQLNVQEEVKESELETV